MKRATILLVEDDGAVRELLDEQLTALGYRVRATEYAEAAIALLEAGAADPDLIITDVRMGAMTGVELCARLKADSRFRLTPVIILTAGGEREVRLAGLAAGADDFFAKPVDPLELETRVAALLRVKALVGSSSGRRT